MFDLSHDNIVAAMQTDDWKLRAFLRAVFRRSLFALCKFGTCFYEPRNLMDAEVYKDSCDWIQWVIATKKRGLLEDPRGHIKSTRVARAGPEWCAIQVPSEEYDFPEEIDRALEFLSTRHHLRGPDSRLLVGCDSKDRAAKFIGSSKADWENNPVLRYAFPELTWANTNRLDYGHWQDGGYSLNGRKNPSIPDEFLTAVGLDSKAQGGRGDGIFIDDLVGETSYRSTSELERRQAWVMTIGFLLENRDYEHPDGGFQLVDGNRWALDDVNSMIHNKFKDWAIWHRAGFRCIVHGLGNCGRWADNEERPCAISDVPLWTARYPNAEALQRIASETDDAMFAAQVLNDPTIASELDVTKLRAFRLEPATVVFDGKPRRLWSAIIPNEDGPDEVIPLAALAAHVLSVDPADSKNPKNARTCASWFAMDRPTGRVFWLDCRADHWTAHEAVDATYELYKEIIVKTGERPRILVEKVACQGYFGDSLKRAAASDIRGRQIIPEPEMIPPAHGLSKDDRIRRRTGNRLGQELLYLRQGLQLPRWEIRHFNTGTKDALDTHVQAEEVFLKVIGAADSNRLAAARKRKRASRIAASGRTGIPL